MALLWADGFDDLATATGADVKSALTRRYTLYGTSNPTFKSIAGRISGYGVNSDSGTAYLRLTKPLTTADTLIVGCAIYPTSTSSSTFLFMYDGETTGVYVGVEPQTGRIIVYRGGVGVLGATVGHLIKYQSWHYIQVKVKCHSSEGTVEVRLGNHPVLSLSGINTKAGANNRHDRVQLNLSSYNFDDFYVADNTGGANNDFLGNVRVVTLFPNVDGGTNEWTPSAGSDHYALVDEGAENDDTDYLSSGTHDQADLWEYSDMAGLGTIKGIQVVTVCRDTDTPIGQIKTLVKTGVTTSEDTPQVVGIARYGARTRVIETDPSTSEAWTEAGVNAAQFGVKLG